MNGVINCTTQYDFAGNVTNPGGCFYCSNQCAVKKLAGPYCGDGIINGPAGSEQCDCNPGDTRCLTGNGLDHNHQYSCTTGSLTAGGCKQTGGYMGNGIIDSAYGEECDCGTSGQVACAAGEDPGTNGCVAVSNTCDSGVGVDRGLNRCVSGKLELVEDCSYITP